MIINEVEINLIQRIREIPMDFLVTHALFPTSNEKKPDITSMEARVVDPPYIKDYDAPSDEGPKAWVKHFDISSWGLIVAEEDDRWIGAVTVAYDSSDILMLEGRSDLAVIWDIRVHPEHRNQGVGSALFKAAVLWSKSKGCVQVNIETQNINLPACRFYSKQGCFLSQVNPEAYSDYPNEVQFIWTKHLGDYIDNSSRNRRSL